MVLFRHRFQRVLLVSIPSTVFSSTPPTSSEEAASPIYDRPGSHAQPSSSSFDLLSLFRRISSSVPLQQEISSGPVPPSERRARLLAAPIEASLLSTKAASLITPELCRQIFGSRMKGAKAPHSQEALDVLKRLMATQEMSSEKRPSVSQTPSEEGLRVTKARKSFWDHLGRACWPAQETEANMLPGARKLKYEQRVELARSIILSDLLAHNRNMRGKRDAIRRRQLGSAVSLSEGETFEKTSVSEDQENEADYLPMQFSPALPRREERERRKITTRVLQSRFQESPMEFAKPKALTKSSDPSFFPCASTRVQVTDDVVTVQLSPTALELQRKERNRDLQRRKLKSNSNSSSLLTHYRRRLQEMDLRIITVVNSMPYQTVTEKNERGEYPANHIPVQNYLTVADLLFDDNSFVTEEEMKAKANPNINDFVIYDLGNKASLVLHQARGSIFLYDIDLLSNIDVARDIQFNQILPPAARFRWHSCLQYGAFCHIRTSKPVKGGVLALDRHRLQLLGYPWARMSGEARIYDATLRDNLARIPMTDVHGLRDEPAGGRVGLSSPSAIVVYEPANSTMFRQFEPLNFQEGAPINRPDFVMAENTFVFVSDYGNRRIVIYQMDTADQFKFSFFRSFSMKDAKNPLAPTSEAFNGVESLGLLIPSLEIRYHPHFANLFACDRYNHRVVKLDFGYYQYTEFFNESLYDNFGFFIEEVEKARPYRDFNHEGVPGPYLEYDSQFGVTGAPGTTNFGKLDQPIAVVAFRHYLFVMQLRTNTLEVFSFNYTDTKQFIHVTRISAQGEYQMQYGFSISFNGYVWIAGVHNSRTSEELGVFRLPRDLRESVREYKIADLQTQCVDFDYMNGSVMADKELLFSVVTNALNLSGLQYYYPDRYGYVEYGEFNLSNTPDGGEGFNFELWNQTIFDGVMSKCEVIYEQTEDMVFGASSGWTTADGSAIAAWDISFSSRRFSSNPIRSIVSGFFFLAQKVFGGLPYVDSPADVRHSSEKKVSHYKGLVRLQEEDEHDSIVKFEQILEPIPEEERILPTAPPMSSCFERYPQIAECATSARDVSLNLFYTLIGLCHELVLLLSEVQSLFYQYIYVPVKYLLDYAYYLVVSFLFSYLWSLLCFGLEGWVVVVMALEKACKPYNSLAVWALAECIFTLLGRGVNFMYHNVDLSKFRFSWCGAAILLFLIIVVAIMVYIIDTTEERCRRRLNGPWVRIQHMRDRWFPVA